MINLLGKEGCSVQIRTVATILVWFVVALLLLNTLLRSKWILPISIVLTVIAVLIYFSPRLRKNKKSQDEKPASTGSNGRILRMI
jgi:heme/copper-type cytochrome/quinol oxidase subunit 2